MSIFKLIIGTSYQSLAIVLIFIGLGLFTMAFLNSPLQLQIAMGIGGAGFFWLGLVQIKRARDEKSGEEKLDKIIAKLDEIQQQLNAEEPNRRSGVVIADALSSGLKFYTEYLTQQKAEGDTEESQLS